MRSTSPRLSALILVGKQYYEMPKYGYKTRSPSFRVNQKTTLDPCSLASVTGEASSLAMRSFFLGCAGAMNCPKLVRLRPSATSPTDRGLVDPVSCRLGMRNDSVPYHHLVPGLLRPVRTQFLPGVARGHAAAGSSLMGLGNEGAICGRPAHDHWM